jgi:hypothetical protein
MVLDHSKLSIQKEWEKKMHREALMDRQLECMHRHTTGIKFRDEILKDPYVRHADAHTFLTQ